MLWSRNFVNLEQEDSLDELKDGRWLSCDVISRVQSLLKKQFPQQNGLQSTNVLKEAKKWKSLPELFVYIRICIPEPKIVYTYLHS